MPTKHEPLPLKKIFLGVGVVFLTGVMYLLQNYGSYFMGSIVGQPSYLLDKYACPESSVAFEVSPVPELFAYTKGNTEANRKEMIRINKKNHGLTAWYSYDKGFDEAGKVALIDILAYEKNPNQWINRIYNAIKNDGSPHGSVDFVTKWLSPDNHNLRTVYPYANGLVIEAVEGHAGYGNYASICTKVVDANGNKLNIVYNIAHLKTLAVSNGQTVSAGTELGKIGSTGNSTTPHAHITIHPDFIWDTNYKSIYNAGYNFYYSTSAVETLVKTIDPIAIMLNPQLAYSVVMDDDKRQALFTNPTQYIASITGAVAFEGDLPFDAGTASILDVPQSVFSDFRILTNVDQVTIGEQISVTVEAVDQDGELYEDFSEDISVVLSSSTATASAISSMSGGRTSFDVSDVIPGEVIIQVSNQGAVSEEKKVLFSDELKYLEVTAPQKISVGNSAAVVLRPVGVRGGVIQESFQVAASVFPAVQSSQSLTVTEGRGEYSFAAQKEGIYELQFTTPEGIQESILVTVADKVIDQPVVVEEPAVEEPTEADTTESTGTEEAPASTEAPEATESTPEVSDTPATEEPAEAEVTTPADPQTDVVFLEGEQYRIHTIDGATVMVFNDREVTGDFPVEMQFTVPNGTQAVSIFTGLNDRNFPDSGELKLSKYTPGQASIRYYPKYVPEDTYKKVVAYDASGAVLAERVFTWSPASVHAFTDVVEGVTDAEIYQAVKALKEAGVVNGNPDGSYGVETPINRAATATILIRAFYADVDLNTLSVPEIDFSDVPLSAWYASAMWFASEGEYQGESKPVIIKGYDGKANPDGNVKIEEFVTMILRLLEVDVETTEPWYEGYIAKAINLGLMTDAERSLIDQPLSRGMVARIMVKAMELAEELIDEGDLEGDFHNVAEEEESAPAPEEPAEPTDEVSDGTGGPEETTVLNEAKEAAESTKPLAAENLAYEFVAGSGLTLTWDSAFTGTFNVYRETVGGLGEIFIGTTGGTAFTDTSAKSGKQYYYRVEFDGTESTRADILVSL